MSNIAGGAWTEIVAAKQISVDAATGDAVYDEANPVKLALAIGADYDEDFNVQPLETLGHLGPKEYNSFGYSCAINLSILVAKNKELFNTIVPNRKDIQENGQLPKWKFIFRSTTAEKTIYEQFVGVVVASYGSQVQTNQFISANMRLFAIERLPGASETGGQGGLDNLNNEVGESS